MDNKSKSGNPVEIPTVIVPRQKKPGKSRAKAKKLGKGKRARTQPQVTTGAPPVGSTPPRPEPRTEISETFPAPRAEQATAPTAAPPVLPTDAPAEPAPAPAPVAVDARMVQGSQCTWIGRMDQAIDDSEGIPECPYCHNNLLTAQDEETIQLGFEAYELGAYHSVNPPPKPHPGYRALMAWMRGQAKCWPTVELAADSFYKETGRLVIPGR